MASSGHVLRLTVLAFLLSCPSLVHAAQQVILGPVDIISLDQPRVAVEVYALPDRSFGPETSNTFLLDTGSQAILVGGAAYWEMFDQGYVTDGTFQEQGIAGTDTYDVSAVYNFRFAGTEGEPHTLDKVRILSHPMADFGFDGIVGMPAMTNRITSMDLRPMSEIELINVDFPGSVPSGNGHRYSIPLGLQWFDPPTQEDPNQPLPTYADLPFLTVNLGNGPVSTQTRMLLDTGAQMSVVSTDLAFAAGLDANNNGTLNDEIIDYVEILGAAGPTMIPVIQADRLSVPTAEGVDLVWTDLQVLLWDIGPGIPGVFSFSPLTTGYLDVMFTGQYGCIEQVHLDFTDAGNQNGMMYLDLNGDFDVVVPEPGTLSLLALLGGLAAVRRSGRSA